LTTRTHQIGSLSIIKIKQQIRKKNIKNPRTWKQRFFIFATLLFLGGVVYTLLCSTLLTVYEFDIQGIKRVDESKIVKIIEHNIDSDIMSYVHRDNYFFVNTGKIGESILEDNRIKNVYVTKEFPNKIIVEIEEYDSIAIWCTDMTMKTCFILDDDTAVRQVMLEDAIVVKNKHFIIVNETYHELSAGDRVMAKKYLKKIEKLGSELVYVLNVEIEQPFTVASRGSNEVRFMTDEGWYIIVDLTHDLDEIFDIAKLFVKKVNLPSRRPNLEYVDMRFPEKIFYKMKDEIEQVEEEARESNDETDNTENKDEGEDKKDDK